MLPYIKPFSFSVPIFFQCLLQIPWWSWWPLQVLETNGMKRVITPKVMSFWTVLRSLHPTRSLQSRHSRTSGWCSPMRKVWGWAFLGCCYSLFWGCSCPFTAVLAGRELLTLEPIHVPGRCRKVGFPASTEQGQRLPPVPGRPTLSLKYHNNSSSY